MAEHKHEDPAELGDVVAHKTFVITMASAAAFIGIVFVFILN